MVCNKKDSKHIQACKNLKDYVAKIEEVPIILTKQEDCELAYKKEQELVKQRFTKSNVGGV